MAHARLDGLLVADFSRVLAGPLCAMTLGDLGADVVKVERPDGGDDTRAWGPPFAGRGLDLLPRASTATSARSRSTSATRATVALARELVARAPTSLIESFRPGTMDALRPRLRDDPRARNPGVVYCSVSGFGSGEAAAALPGYDLLLQAMGGLMRVTGEADGRPLKVGAALVDMLCGLHAAIGHPRRAARARAPTARASASRCR